MTPQEKSDRAQALLQDPVFLDVLKSMREAVVSKLEACPISDTEQQRDITVTLQLLKEIPVRLRHLITDAEVVKSQKQHDEFIERTRQRLKPSGGGSPGRG